jgi:hypothetical protein
VSSTSASAAPTTDTPQALARARAASGRLPSWWPLAALVLLGAVIRFSTLDLQSLWYDEAFTPVHTLRPSLGTTLHELVRHENTPPLWYLLVWVWTRAFGTGAVALRFLSALSGTLLVVVGWAIGREVGSRRTAILLAAIVALNPFLVWYSQEARAYEFYAFFSGLSLLYFLRARRDPTRAALAGWSASSTLAILSEYFAVFLVLLEALLLLVIHARQPADPREGEPPGGSAAAGAPVAPRSTGPASPAAAAGKRIPRLHRGVLVACIPVVLCCAALLPLVIAQGGHGTQWIGRWALSSRLIQTPGYYLLGAEGAKLGHGLLALAAIPGLAAIVLLVWLIAGNKIRGRAYDDLLTLIGLGLVAILIPLALALAGHDYFAPRNLIADWMPLSAALALLLTLPAAGRAGTVIALLVCFGFAVVVLATNLSHRLQRGNWRAVADIVRPGSSERAIVTLHLGSAPLEYYLPQLGVRVLAPERSVRIRELDEVGYRPLRPGAEQPPTPAFHAAGRSEVHGLLVFRFVAPTPQVLNERLLGTLTLTGEPGETLVPASLETRAG